MRILVAEDDAASCLVLEAAVTSLGHDCVVATNGEEAWRLFSTVDVDAVIRDRMMPGIDGVELCRRIRASERDTYPYFIFLTAFDKKADVLSGMEAGADDYLVKPLDIDDLKMRLFVASRVTSLHRQLSQQSAQLERLNRQLLDQSRTDPLTQLGSRLRLSEDLDNIQARVDRYGHTCCAVMCDVDFFKAYNDSKGDLAGDEVLQAVSRALMNTARSGDQFYRYGGEEFLILLPEQSLDDGLVAAERYRLAIEEFAIPHDSHPPAKGVHISAGVALLSHSEGKSVEAWLNEADAALYGAKQLGRNRVLADGKPLAALDLHQIDPQEV